MKVVAIYQDKGSTTDMLTVITDDRDIMRGTVACLNYHKDRSGVTSDWSERIERRICHLSDDRTRLIFSPQNFLGKLIKFEDLDGEVQKYIAERILL